jgi:ABC-2 type transport system permease protein
MIEELKCELKKLLRDPAFVLPSFSFPIAFFLLFGVILPFAKSDAARWVVMANYAAFAVLASSLFASSIPLARERETGIYALKRASPLSHLHFLGAKLIAAALFATLSAMAVVALACASYGVLPSVGASAAFLIIAPTSGLAIATIGLCVGSFVRTNAAAMLANLIFMPLAFLGGLAMPLQVMPKMVQSMAHVLPSFHLGEMLRGALSPALSVSGAQLLQAVLCLGTIAVIALWVTVQKLQRSVD